MKRQSKSEKPKAKSERKKYSTPEIIEYGSVKEFTHALTGTMGTDGGMTAPRTATMACISPAPFVEEHRLLIGDEKLQSLYRDAIFAAVKPGDVVLDLGSGSGLHAFFACQAGAKKVYAIEAGGIIAIAQAAAHRNGFGDRIEFVYGNSDELRLPEKVDVIISNIGYLLSLQYLPDAAKRFLKPGGKMIPCEIKNTFVPVETKEFYEDKISFWQKPHYGLDFSDFQPFATNRAHANHCLPEHFLAEPQALTPFILSQKLKPNYRWEREFKATRNGTIYGLLGWYEFNLGNGHWLSTQPPLELSPQIWTQPLLPCRQPIKVQAGEKIQLEMAMYLKGSYEEPIWSWSLKTENSKVAQSSFDAIPLSPEILAKIAD